jgi:hypothetical protein
MKTWFACASALALLAACGSSKEANEAFAAMNIGDGKEGMIRYEGKSGAGDKITLKNVILGPEGQGMKAQSLALDGLGMSEDGKPLFTGLSIKNLTPEQEVPGVSFQLATVTLDGLSPVVGQYLATAFNEGGPQGEAPAFEAWEMSKFSVNGMTLKTDLAQMGMGGGMVNVYLDEFSVADLKDTVFGGAKFAGFKGDFDVPAEAGAGFPIVGKFDFGTGDVKGIRGGIFAQAVEAGMNAAMDPEAMATLQADIMASFTSPLEPGYDSLTWTPILIEASGAKLTTTELKQTTTRDANGVVTSLSQPRSSMTFATDAAGGQLGQMAGMFMSMVGYPTIELYASAEATYDPATDLTRYADYNFGLTDGFDIKANGGFFGLTEAIGVMMSAMDTMAYDPYSDPSYDPYADPPMEPPAPPAPDFSGLANFKIADLELTLTDKSFVNKMLTLAPMMGGGDPEVLRADIVNMLSTAGTDFAGAGVDPALANELTAAVSAFIQSPGTLTVKRAPAQPVAPMVEGAALTKEALGFTVTHTPAN